MQRKHTHLSLLIALLGVTLLNAGAFASAQQDGEPGPGCRSFITGVGEGPACGDDPNVALLHAAGLQSETPRTFIVLDDQGCIIDAVACDQETANAAHLSLESHQTNLARYDFGDGTTVLVASAPSCSIYVGTCSGDGDCNIFAGTCSGFGDCTIYVGTCGSDGECSIYVGICHGDCDVFVGICYGECDKFVGVCFDGGTCTYFVGLCYDNCSIFAGACYEGTCTIFVGGCGSPPDNQVMYHGFHLQPTEYDDDSGIQFANHRDDNAFTRLTFQEM